MSSFSFVDVHYFIFPNLVATVVIVEKLARHLQIFICACARFQKTLCDNCNCEKLRASLTCMWQIPGVTC